MKTHKLERDFERFLRDLDKMTLEQEKHLLNKYDEQIASIIEWGTGRCYGVGSTAR